MTHTEWVIQYDSYCVTQKHEWYYVLLFLVSSIAIATTSVKTTDNCWKQRNCNFLCLIKMYRLYHEISHSYTLSFFNKSGMWWLNVYLTFLTDEYMITVCLTVVDQTVPWMTKRINNVCAFFTLFSLPTLPPQSIFPMVQGNHFVPIWVSDGHQMSSHPKNNTFATDSSII